MMSFPLRKGEVGLGQKNFLNLENRCGQVRLHAVLILQPVNLRFQLVFAAQALIEPRQFMGKYVKKTWNKRKIWHLWYRLKLRTTFSKCSVRS
jgi:hypothetical protein